MGYSGAVPSEDSSGKRTRRGSITKTGNAHLRRIVVEAAWSYRNRPAIGPRLRKRQEGVPEPVKEIAWKAQIRLHKRYTKLAAAGKDQWKISKRGIQIATGTIVDATILHAPSSTKNKAGQRDPERHQMKKGNQWYFGINAHVGVASKSKLVHSVTTSAASVADKHMLPDLLHGEEKKVWGDAAYQGQSQTIREAAPRAQDMTHRRTKFKNYVDELQKKKNTTKSRVRAKVEHVLRVLKRQFGFDRVRYRGLAKNHHRLCACFALVNLYHHRKRLLVQRA